ncbi:cyclic peptide export ABC transporter [Pseudoalteromonas prydzensis]|uniref:Cyclic peptide export ABC transporter n=1 Tax=Pseudoalteromonas prydzensis TaxID=182141 RepID=A0ABR9FJN1_9GAMM|nr:cyclic peptide export ABC transporter [Pseudoalteromonas prydzensis]MBE0457045.1 cyclic peptide export ABC transporter [Pseudoalteromonas prydzensis]
MLRYLIRQSQGLFYAAMLTSAICGVCAVLLLTQINNVLGATHQEAGQYLGLFVALVLAVLFFQVVASCLFERLCQQTHAKLRRYISERVLHADYRQLEEVGGAKIQSALSEHCLKVAEFFVRLPVIVVNGIIVVGCMAYIAWLSVDVFLMSLLVLGLGSIGYHLVHLKAIGYLTKAAKEQDYLYGHFRSLVDGAKELRLNAQKRQHFSEKVLGDSIEKVREQRTVGMSVFVISTAWGNFLIYAFIGLVLFALVADSTQRTEIITGFAIVFIYMIAPLENLLKALPAANIAKASAERIQALTKHLSQDPCSTVSQKKINSFKQLELQGVTHQFYHEPSDDLFMLGPIDLSFKPGEIVFLVGGNGSGKTTLAKLLVGLYQSKTGELRLDGEKISADDIDDYRQLFSTVFSDFYLFEQLLDIPSAELDTAANQLLEKLQLNSKVSVTDGVFSTRSLSQGQRKRLAMVVAHLEQRPFLVFDEWAADQDPVFKEVFYRQLLPELKALGKTLLVISHDDRYFDCADRVLRMDHGQLQHQNGIAA